MPVNAAECREGVRQIYDGLSMLADTSGFASTRIAPRPGPFGTTIAHGHLTLSLMGHLPRAVAENAPRVEGQNGVVAEAASDGS